MIDGVKIKKIETHLDERGYFREILRDDDRILERFGQISMSLTKPGVIKAFHYHKGQDDIFYVVAGNAQLALYDLRKNSKTYKQVYTFNINEAEQNLIFIPRMVAHGYKSLGKKPLLVLYIMSSSYDKKNPDERRISHDDEEIGFDWSKYK